MTEFIVFSVSSGADLVTIGENLESWFKIQVGPCELKSSPAVKEALDYIQAASTGVPEYKEGHEKNVAIKLIRSMDGKDINVLAVFKAFALAAKKVEIARRLAEWPIAESETSKLVKSLLKAYRNQSYKLIDSIIHQHVSLDPSHVVFKKLRGMRAALQLFEAAEDGQRLRMPHTLVAKGLIEDVDSEDASAVAGVLVTIKLMTLASELSPDFKPEYAKWRDAIAKCLSN